VYCVLCIVYCCVLCIVHWHWSAQIADACVGYTWADLEHLVRESTICFMKRVSNADASSLESPADDASISMQDFVNAMRLVAPSTKRTGGNEIVQVPKTPWNTIGGLEHVKQQLRKAVEWPLFHADKMASFGIRASSGILLHGPPGCGKTTLVKAICSASNVAFLALSGATIYSMYLGVAEATIRQCFASVCI
jgi:transitional endoplasmic reticulum ATPase